MKDAILRGQGIPVFLRRRGTGFRLFWAFALGLLVLQGSGPWRGNVSGAGCAGGVCAVALAAESVPPILIEDFEAPPLGGLPAGWKQTRGGAGSAGAGVERLYGGAGGPSRALKWEYTFAGDSTASPWFEVGPGGSPLPRQLARLACLVRGDGSRNGLGVRFADREGETFEWRISLSWTGWKSTEFEVGPRGALPVGPPRNGTPDLPLVFQGFRITRSAGGAARGEVWLDTLAAECNFGALQTLYDPTTGVAVGDWKPTLTRSRSARAGGGIVARAGREIQALRLEWEFELTGDARVEWVRPAPLPGAGGALLLEVFGDGSQTLLRLRLRDAQGRLVEPRSGPYLVDWSGWRVLYLDLRDLRGSMGAAPTGPLAFHSLVMDDVSPGDNLPGVESARRGELFLGRLLFAPE